MKCSEVELAIEQDGLSPLPAVAKGHIAGCETCRNFVEDLFAVLRAAHALPAEEEPPARLWVSIRAQLESEGVIRGAGATEKASWLDTLREFFLGHAVATSAVGLAILAAAYVEVRNAPPLSLNAPRPPVVYVLPYAETATYLNQQEKEVADLFPASGVTTPVNASLRENLQILNSFIADCERRVQEDPQDDLARDYLNGAYQQKAELLATMMERGGGVN